MMTDIKHECAALAVLHEAIDIEFRHGEIFDAVETIKFNGPFYTHEQVAEAVEAAYREGAKEFASEINGWPGAICSAWHHSQAKAGLKE